MSLLVAVGCGKCAWSSIACRGTSDTKSGDDRTPFLAAPLTGTSYLKNGAASVPPTGLDGGQRGHSLCSGAIKVHVLPL